MLIVLIVVLISALGLLGYALISGRLTLHRLPSEIGGYPTPMLALTAASAVVFLTLSVL